MIKVLERLALRIAIVILCILYIEWSPLILIVGVFLVYITNAPAIQRPKGADGQVGSEATQAPLESSGAKKPAKRQRSSREDDQEHESEEQFLARERYEEWCKDH